MTKRRNGGLTRSELLALVLVTAAGALLRGWGLGRPGSYVFDEIYYVPDALSYIHGTGTEESWVHPPLGKWIIALGAGLLGDDPVGWRISSVVFGSLVLALTFLLALRLLRSIGWATVSAALVAIDGLQVVHSRIAMLEIFLSAFVLAGALLAMVYAEQAGADGGRRELGWLAASGVLLGAALAVKWSALPVIVLVALGLVVSSPAPRRRALAVAGLLGIVPLLVYAVSYANYWNGPDASLGGWVRLHASMLEFHTSTTARHPYASSSVTWLVLRRPVAYFFRSGGGRTEHILALGNPLLWWGFLVTVPLLVRSWLLRGDRTADVVFLGLAGLYLPWLLVRRTSFLYYLTPLVPVMALGVTWALRRLWQSSRLRRLCQAGVVAYLGATVVTAALLLPVWLGRPISDQHWGRLMVFRTWI